jgi:CheY-like chemotaxis protein
MAMERARVLIVEDDKDTGEALAALLQAHGFEVMRCLEGRRAIAEAALWRPTAAIIDIGLPGITGYAVAQYLKGLPSAQDVLLIAVTGYSDAADIELARYAGFHWHFSKPAESAQLIDILENRGRHSGAIGSGVPLLAAQ